MRVKLIQVTQNPIDVMWTAARTCYSEKSPVEMWDEIYYPSEEWQKLNDEKYNQQTKKHWNLVKKVLDSGHQSIAEHVYFTFAIEGVDRALTHQLVRHRAGIVFSQQSQRYVQPKNVEDLYEFMSFIIKGQYDLIRERQLDIKLLGEELPENYSGDICNKWIWNIINKYFVYEDKVPGLDSDKNVLACSELRDQYFKAFYSYIKLLALGVKGEDARNVLPNATKTNITMSVNYRELIHMCNLRLCTRAQLPIRNLFKEIVKCVKEVDERLASYLVPACEVHGVCQEKMCCGRKPKFEDVMNAYNYYNTFIEPVNSPESLSKDDFNMLMEAIVNPKVNYKLAEFMKQPNILDN